MMDAVPSATAGRDPSATPRTVRVAVWQLAAGRMPAPAERKRLREIAPDVVVLPEYFAVDGVPPPRTSVQFDRNIDWLRALAVELNGVVVGGSIMEKEGKDFFNTCFVFDRRMHVGFYRKANPTARELGAGIAPGPGPRILRGGGLSIGVLVCADVLAPGAFEAMRGADIVAVPTSSPHLPEDTLEAKARRDQEIFVAGARASGAYVVKSCATGSLAGHRLQGRSLVAAPWGVLDRVPPEGEDSEALLVVDLSLGELARRRDEAA